MRFYLLIFSVLIALDSSSLFAKSKKQNNKKQDWHKSWFVYKKTPKYNLRINVYSLFRERNKKSVTTLYYLKDVSKRIKKNPNQALFPELYKNKKDKEVHEIVFKKDALNTNCVLDISNSKIFNNIEGYKNVESTYLNLRCEVDSKIIKFGSAVCHSLESDKQKIELATEGGEASSQTVVIQKKDKFMTHMISYGCLYEHL